MALKVFVTGVSGLLGKALLFSLFGKCEVFGTYYSNSSIENIGIKVSRIDIRDAKALNDFVEVFKPDVIIHTAAITDVDYCEQNKNLAYEVNVKGTEIVLDLAKRNRAKFVYISTDYVFDGEKGFYNEEDKCEPINYYGYTKRQGELISLQYNNSLVIRTSIYGFNPNGSKPGIEKILEQAKNKEKIFAPIDVYSSSISVVSFSKALLNLIEIDLNGIFNIGVKSKVSRFELLQKIISTAGIRNYFLVPITFEEYSLTKKAKRPKDVSLNVSKLEHKTGQELPSIEEDIEEMFSKCEEYFLFFGGKSECENLRNSKTR